MNRRGSGLGLFALLVYLFLYAPILVLAALSFNESRSSALWEGFTFAWYLKLLQNAQVMQALRTSLIVAFVSTVFSTVLGTAAALAFHRHRFRRGAAIEALFALPIVVPEIVIASSMVLLFAALSLRLGLLTVVLAHVAFSISYVVVVVRARLAGFDRTLEEAAMDLGAGPWRTLWTVTLPLCAPAILAGALLAFALSIDDYVITSFVAGVGSTTLPLQIYSMVRSGVSPEINAVSTLLLLATSLLLLAAHLLERGKPARLCAAPAGLGLALLAGPFLIGGPAAAAGEKVLNLYIWSNYIAPETLAKFEARHGVKVNVDLYDSNEALLAKLQAGNANYDVVCPSNYAVAILARQELLHPLDLTALPNLAHVDPAFLDRPHDPGNRLSIPYFWGTTGIAYRKSRTGPIDSWAALWEPRFKGRILMLDDARETLGIALLLSRDGHGVNETDERALRQAKELLLVQKPLVRTYNSADFDQVLLAGDVWLAQGWSGQFARAMDEDPDIEYVVPKEGSSFFLDSLAIPRGAPNPALGHAFLDFVMEPEIAAEICMTMRYSTPNRAARALLPAAIRDHPAIFPPPDVMNRVELLEDVGDATVLYDRLWTEVKSAR
ncbi:MAG: extracellular solute-binding protein [Vicinamibacteria bacterium]|nr:extracellular solute-binding protein [Vicinamibacteria bacterium]